MKPPLIFSAELSGITTRYEWLWLKTRLMQTEHLISIQASCCVTLRHDVKVFLVSSSSSFFFLISFLLILKMLDAN